jgi:hypothetical protein
MIPYLDAMQREASDLSCYEYAFCQLKDGKALSSEYGTILDSLKEWGYNQVSQPKEGDLVIYLHNEEPTHAGIYRGDGLVESKWGNQRPLVYLHQLNDVPTSYGNQVMFFHPPLK